ncbi:hypothetical protein D3C78_1531330 [compost metagenome]
MSTSLLADCSGVSVASAGAILVSNAPGWTEITLIPMLSKSSAMQSDNIFWATFAMR